MARHEIAEKLSTLLEKPGHIWDEADVVYFFVQIRKLLDHSRNVTQQDIPHLRFYCDWVAHISKDRIDQTTLSVIKSLEADINKQIKNPMWSGGRAAINFTYFTSLKNEVINFLKKEEVDCNILDKEEQWTTVITTLVKVLENQPLNIAEKYETNIKQLIFLPAAPQLVILHIDFYKPVIDRNGKKNYYYTLKNAY